MAKIFSCLHHDSDSLEGQARLNVLIHWQFCVSEGGTCHCRSTGYKAYALIVFLQSSL